MGRRDKVDRYKYSLKVEREKGREELQFVITRKALRENMDHSKIADLTDLSLEEVKRLAADLT